MWVEKVGDKCSKQKRWHLVRSGGRDWGVFEILEASWCGKGQSLKKLIRPTARLRWSFMSHWGDWIFS